MTTRAKSILKALEKNDIARGKLQAEVIEEEVEEETTLTEVEKIISELDLNTMSPMQAFMLLGDLKDKIDGDK